jgi:hypothetical protein
MPNAMPEFRTMSEFLDLVFHQVKQLDTAIPIKFRGARHVANSTARCGLIGKSERSDSWKCLASAFQKVIFFKRVVASPTVIASIREAGT